MNEISLDFPDAGEFSYDSQRPTYYSERYAWALHKHQAALSAAGAKISVETASHADQIAAISSFSTALQTWSQGTADSLSSFLTGDENAPLPVLPEFPLLPELLEGAVSLIPGGKLALMVKGALPFVTGFLKLKKVGSPKTYNDGTGISSQSIE